MNLSKLYTLSHIEKEVLEKGLTFIQTPGPVDRRQLSGFIYLSQENKTFRLFQIFTNLLPPTIFWDLILETKWSILTGDGSYPKGLWSSK